MKNLTTTYLIPFELAELINKQPSLLSSELFEKGELIKDLNLKGFQSYQWNPTFEDTLEILDQCGFSNFSNYLETQQINIQCDTDYCSSFFNRITLEDLF